MAKVSAKFISLSVAGLLLAAPPAASSSVLCVRADGHVAIEPSKAGLSGGCDGTSGASEHAPHLHRPSETAAQAGTDSSCGSCYDAAISHEALHHTRDDDIQDNASRQPFRMASPPRLTLGALTGEPFIPRAPPPASVTLSCLGTVVILC